MNPDIDNKETMIEYDKDYDTILHSKLYANEKLVSDFATKILMFLVCVFCFMILLLI